MSVSFFYSLSNIPDQCHGGCWSLVRQPVLTHHSESKPTLHRKKLIPELHSELSCMRELCQRSASAPAAHPYEAAQATSLRMCFPPSSMSDAEGCARQQLQGWCCCGPQAEVNRISVSVRASHCSTQDTLCQLQ